VRDGKPGFDEPIEFAIGLNPAGVNSTIDTNCHRCHQIAFYQKNSMPPTPRAALLKKNSGAGPEATVEGGSLCVVAVGRIGRLRPFVA